ncbi:N-alpha-acetyltransferase 30 [Diachasma alloeum]|uniref:N-alpha-acetyltransferase 30 n=1 Tax=Diachasma alloeum TaxID=454923 RepID=UPI0007383BBE|nr:N-alpha-acetyltransferase 30 [Diachasma alloeum]XP_015109483.1 N-alpha-acetyltransferase 30 [Diachasma alloeum]
MENDVLKRDEKSPNVEDQTLTECEVPDISTLHIKSRLSPQTICENTEEPRANGLQQINGVYGSPKLNFDSPDTPRTVDTSRLSQLHETETTCRENEDSDIIYVSYSSELQMPDIMKLIQKDLSEPYSIYTYRYFIHNWPKLCFLAMHGEECIGAIVCKLDIHRKVIKRGYIAMLAVDVNYRKRKIGSSLVRRAIRAMVEDDADEVVLETEITNRPALRLYENLGFVRDKRLFRYYLNGVDALRLKLWLR